MATEKATGRQAADYGDQAAGLHNVCDDLIGAVAGGLDEHAAAGFYLPLGPAAILAPPGQHRGKGWRCRAHAMTGQTPARPARPVPSKPEQPA
jgi:hypothetical protein